MSEVDDLSFVIDDGVLSESWVIVRSTGVFIQGGWVTTETQVPGYGVVSVATPEDMDEIPEADRVTGMMVFHSQPRIYATQFDPADQVQRVADKMLWTFQLWRVLHVFPYPNRNYWKAFAVRMQGN
jgi:hypothetical protein